MTIATLLWSAADAHPERTAVRTADRTVSYAQLRARASAVAAALVAARVEPGERVAILLPNGVDAAAAIYGVAAAGAVFTVVNWLSRPRQVEQILAVTGARVLLTTRAWDGLQPRRLESVTPCWYIEEVSVGPPWDPVPRTAEQLAQICFTSGSTGAPKGVMVTQGNLLAGIGTVQRFLGVEATDRIASLLPFSFVYGLNQLNLSIATGATLDVIDPTLAVDTVEAVIGRECTVLAAVPPLWGQLLAVPGFARAAASLRVLTCAGGRLPPDRVRALRSALPAARLFLMYGLTEVFRSTYLPPDEVDAHPDSMGYAVPGSRVEVLRDDGTVCAAGEIGELVHAGPTVALGYWQDPDGTARVFREREDADGIRARWVFSGDLVRRDEEGRLYYVGRRDRMIKTLGYRVSPDEVTDAIHDSGLVTDAALTTEPDPARGARIVAHVVLRPEATLDALRRWCGAELPRHLLPARWTVHEQLPRNASGKHDLVHLERGDP